MRHVDAQTKTLKPEKAMEKGRKGRDTQRHRWRAKGRRGQRRRARGRRRLQRKRAGLIATLLRRDRLLRSANRIARGRR